MNSLLLKKMFVVALLVLTSGLLEAQDKQQVSRQFEFEYRVRLEKLSGEKGRVWIPIAQSDAFQKVEILEQQFPSEPQRTQDEKYGNHMCYFEFVPGKGVQEVLLKYRVTRKEVKGLSKQKTESESGSETQSSETYLAANQLVPTKGKSVELFDAYAKSQNWETKTSTKELGRNLYQFVREHMSYDKSKPGYGNGDVAWACDSKTGNCTDFHSLFISIARNRKVPAKFEIGFPLPKQRGAGKIGGYHCWARFFDQQVGWIPVDISEADKQPEMAEYFFGNLTENRIHFTTGRDLTLVPKQQAPPLNYFIYPHVEVDGEVVAVKDLEMQFNYRDIDAG